MADQTPTPFSPSRTGKWTIAAIFAVGIAVLVGLFLSPRARPPAEPQGLLAGGPNRPVLFVLLDCGNSSVTEDAIADAVRDLHKNPDVVLLLNVDGAAVAPAAGKLGMAATFHPSQGSRVRPDSAIDRTTTAAILTRHAAYDTTPIRASERRNIGLLSITAIDNHRVAVSLLHVAEKTEANAVPFPTAVGQANVVAGRSGDGLFAIAPASPGIGVITVTERRSNPDRILFTLSQQATTAPVPQ